MAFQTFHKLGPYRFRILAAGLFIVFLVSTWFLFQQKPQYPEELHINLQEQLKVLIENRLYENDPELINDLTFQEVRTEATVQEGQLKAYFKYSFTDKQEVKTVVQGTALIYRRGLQSSNDHELWILTDIQTNSTFLDFEQPITIFPNSRNTDRRTEALSEKNKERPAPEGKGSQATREEKNTESGFDAQEESSQEESGLPAEKQDQDTKTGSDVRNEDSTSLQETSAERQSAKSHSHSSDENSPVQPETVEETDTETNSEPEKTEDNSSAIPQNTE